MPKDKLFDSLDKNKSLALPGSNVPIYIDLIFLLIVQAFSNHVNANPETLRELFVDFEG